MSDPIVSVIVPVYNVEKFLDQCLSSIENQTLEDMEILVLNDGSTDASAEIIQKHAENDPRIFVLNKDNEGYGATCNRGVDLAKGEWIAIVEPDDWIGEDMLFDMVNFACDSEIEYGKKVDIVKTPWFDVKNWGEGDDPFEIKSYLYSRLKTDLKPTDITQKTPLLEKHPSIWSAIYRRKFLQKNNIRFPEYPGAGWVDNPFLIDTLATAESIVYLNKPYYHYRVDLPGSTLNHKTDELVALPFERWCEMTKRLKEMGVTDEGVCMAHYKRGFDYVHGAIVDDGWGNPVVQEKTKQVFDMMEPDMVFKTETFYPKVKLLYAEVEGLDVAIPVQELHQLKFYAKETLVFLKQRGLKGTSKLVTRQVKRLVRG